MRYAAQRYGTWDWLDLEVPFITDGPEWGLSTYGVMYATVAPDIGLQKAADGRPVLEEWGTLIHAETGTGASSRRWTGIVVRSELNGKDWDVTIREFPGYFDGTPVETTVWGVFADPAALFRKITTDVQKMPNANLNITVNGSTKLRVGTDSDDKAAAAKKVMDADKKVVDAKNKIKTAASDAQQKQTKANAKINDAKQKEINALQDNVNRLTKAKAPKAQIDAARAQVTAKRNALTALKAQQKPTIDALKAATDAAQKEKERVDKIYEKSREAHEKAREKAQEDGGAYKFLAEDTPDAFDSITTLCKDTGLEWTTQTKYSNGAPNLHINVHYPKAGSRRDDLVFEQGININTELHLVRDGEEYANASIGIGAGEGDKSIRGSIASTSPRLRRVTVYEDQKLKKQSQLLAAMRADLKKRTGVLYVPEIEVIGHELAPMFSWDVGDIIRVSGNVPHHGYYSALHRIISWQMLGDTKALIRLELAT